MSTYPVAKIDLAALKHNFERVKTLAPNSKIMSVIKANAYGHGDIEVATALADSDGFAVARLEEGIRLRKAGIKHPITLLEGIHDQSQYDQAAEWQLSPVLHRLEHIDFIEHGQKALPACWLMVETGMHRLGINPQNIDDAYQRLSNLANAPAEIDLMSHFANADQPNDQRNQQQLSQILALELTNELPVSMANSAATIALASSHQPWCRPGIMLYGASPFDDKTSEQLDLKPVMTLKAQLISIEILKTGEQVGYGGDWQAEQTTRVGIVNIGYGDGYSRLLSNQGQVAIRGQKVNVLGRVSMDMICIDLAELPSAKVGDEVELWGQQIAINDVADKAQTIPYELLCQLNQRVPRQYHG